MLRSRRGRRRSLLGRAAWLVAAASCLLALLVVGLLAVPLYDRFVAYPALDRELAAMRTEAAPVTLDDGWNEYRAVIHAHSALSHDSGIPFTEILAAAHEAGADAMFMVDHCIDDKADFSLQWTGLHEGIRFLRGWEIRDQLLIWALPPDTVVDCTRPVADIAQQARVLGGVSAFAHNDAPRPLELHDVPAMEIYDLRDDFRDEKLWKVLPDLLVNGGAWPDLAIHAIFDRQDAILHLWDEQNRTHHLAGIGAADAHQNLGLRATYTADDHFQLHQSSKKLLLDMRLNALTRPLVDLLFGPLVAGRELLRLDLDPYARSLRYVNTHLLAHDNSEAALLDALRTGRAFVAFNLLADAKGFVLFAGDSTQRASLGESAALTPTLKLQGEAPLPARWTIVRDGQIVATSEGRRLDWAIPQPGSYRVELALKAGDHWLDWIYGNPILIRAPGT